MALSGQFKLPPLKLTESLTKTSSIHRGIASQHQTESVDKMVVSQDEDGGEPFVPDLFPDVPEDTVVPSYHELESKSAIRDWENLRTRMLSASTECSAMPLGQLCLLCPSPAEYRCRECGPVAFYCEGCFNLLHEKANFFHVPEKWEVIIVILLLVCSCFIYI